MSLEPKQYQKDSLNTLKQFFTLAASVGAAQAFKECIDEPVPYNDRMNGVPSVCLRVPTGGGKTLLGAHSIPIAAQHYASTDTPMVLWLVPTDMIRQQTLAALSSVDHPYRQALQSYYGDRLKVCDIDGLQALNKHDVAQSCIVIVTTIQIFNIDKDKTFQRNAYAFDEALSPHFMDINTQHYPDLDKVTKDTLQHQPYLTEKDIGRVKHSLVNFFHLHRPIIIVDEAHKNRGGKSFFPTLQRLNPRCLIELTATPKDNNVLYSVSAAELKTADMIKLPVVLTEHTSAWQDCIRDALLQRAELEILAQKEAQYIRPILLIQAQDKNGEANVDVVKQHLINDCNTAENWIAISTGQTKELEDQNLFSPTNPIRIVITVEALKEGWDCSFAYILASLQNIRSATDVEQLLGRVLRMPYAQTRSQPALNKAYAHVISTSIAEAVTTLKDRMVENMGFNKWEADAALMASPQHTLDLGQTDQTLEPPQTDPEVLVSIPFTLKSEDFSPELQASVKAFETSQGTSLVIQKGTSDEVFNRIQEAVTELATPKQKAVVEASFDDARAERQAYFAPENWNKIFALIPQLGLFIDGEWQLADKEIIEDFVEWDLLGTPVQLKQFNIKETVNSFEIDLNIQEQKLSYGLADSKQLQFNDMPTSITEQDLVNWLDRKTRRQGLTQVQLRAYLTKLVSHLIHDRKFSLTSLHRAQFQLALAVSAELDRLFELARHQAFQGDLFSHLQVSSQLDAYHAFEFKVGQYPVRKPYRGSWKFKNHFYTQIDDLREKTDSGKHTEEFICARLLDLHPQVKYWVRNIPKQPQVSFWLPTERDYFYPDFVAELIDGSIFVLEYKGDHLVTADDARIKNDIGLQWAKNSNGKRIFLMARSKDEDGRSLEDQINQALSVIG